MGKLINLHHLMTEELIIRECRSGNKKYYEMLYRHFYSYAMGVSLRYGNSREDAFEILNDSFLKVFDKIEQFVPEQPFKAWLRRIRSEEHTSELQSLMRISYDVLCLQK